MVLVKMSFQTRDLMSWENFMIESVLKIYQTMLKEYQESGWGLMEGQTLTLLAASYKTNLTVTL